MNDQQEQDTASQDQDSERQLPIEIAYALPERQLILEFSVAAGTSPRDAVIQSDIDAYFPEIDKQSCDLGIFGKAVRPNQQLEPGDRIEIYRPLIADPKEVRKKRAAQGLRTKKGGGAQGAGSDTEAQDA